MCFGLMFAVVANSINVSQNDTHLLRHSHELPEVVEDAPAYSGVRIDDIKRPFPAHMVLWFCFVFFKYMVICVL